MAKYTYLRNLREEVQALESSNPDCLRHLLNILGNAMNEIARLEDRLEALERVTAE
jgi:hypothetical protein